MFIYLTSKRYPGSTADHAYIHALAQAFARQLKDKFLLVVDSWGANATIPTYIIPAPHRFRTLYHFFHFPYFVFSQRLTGEETLFFANDWNLLLIALFWKHVLFARYRVVSDWHMMLRNWKDGVVARGSSLLITTSEHLAGLISSKTGVPLSKIRTVHGGVDLLSYVQPAASRAEFGFPESARLIGYVGYFKTLGQDKGIGTMLDALAHLPENDVMVFVGARASEVEEYTAYARRLGVEKRCRFILAVSSDKVAAYEKAMDVLVIPYPNEPHFRDFGFPMKTYEYLAAQKPIVYSDLDIIDEVLSGKGTPFTAGDPVALAQALSHLKSPAQPISMTEYSWDAKAERILEAADGYL